MGSIHPLLPLCLPADVEVVSEAEKLVEELDDFSPHAERPLLIIRTDPHHKKRFFVQNVTSCPCPEAINSSLPYRLGYARQHMLTHKGVANRIVSDAVEKGYRTVALLLVDGLSYHDAMNWKEQTEPCFVDGPSITFAQTEDGTIAPDIGFPAIVGTPPLARRLAEVGIPHSRGYSYWEREANDVSAVLFDGMPLNRVGDMSEALDLLSNEKLSGVYVQLVREGLDGLAHRRRELSVDEIQSAVGAIHEDYLGLVELLADSKVWGAAYLTADHGILWKAQHEFGGVEGVGQQHPRYAFQLPLDSGCASKFKMQHQTYYLYHYPYLGSRIRADDSGVHGGLSYWESIVPFVRTEVNI